MDVVKDKLKADSIIQYKIEERSTISRRLIISDDRMKQLINIMKEDTISSADKVENLKNEIFKFTNENSFIKSKSMGELMEQTLEYLKRNYQNVSLIDLI
jgi:replicative DNA helicase